MTRTKWMRLVVRDTADVIRWASQQNARQLDEFRYRVIAGREFVSFRMVTRYPIEIGTCDIIVVAHARGSIVQRLATGLRATTRRRSPKQAVNARAKRCPDLTVDQAQYAFETCLALLISAVDLVEAHKDELWAKYHANESGHVPAILAELQTAHPELPAILYGWAISWVWFWHHLK